MAGPVTAQAATPTVSTVVTGLNNPRGLTFANGRVYVAEAGKGGTCYGSGQQQICVGATGAVGYVASPAGRATYQQVVRNLISAGGPGGVAAEGPAAVAIDGRGYLTGVVGGNAPGALAELPPGVPASLVSQAKRQLGMLFRAYNGRAVSLASVGDVDYLWTRNHKWLWNEFPDANPNGLTFAGGRWWVADAGANLLASVNSRGNVATVTYLPEPAKAPRDAVPTWVAVGPDRYAYVAELLGGYFGKGRARVWRVNPATGAARVWARGLTAVNGCGFDRLGRFYATEFQVNGLDESPTASPVGAVIRFNRNGTRTTLGLGKLYWPSGFAAGPDGSIYVSNCSIAPASGMPGPPNAPCKSGGTIVRIR